MKLVLKAGKNFPEHAAANKLHGVLWLPAELCASWADDYLSCRSRNYFAATGRDIPRRVTVNHASFLRGYATRKRNWLNERENASSNDRSEVVTYLFLINANRSSLIGSKVWIAIKGFVYSQERTGFSINCNRSFNYFYHCRIL